MRKHEWDILPPSFTPATGTVHVWRVNFLAAEAAWTANVALLAADERERAARFRRPRDGQQYAHTRASLRRLLGRLSRTAPEALCFAYGAQGKPTLVSDAVSLPLSFNVSHSGDFALVAVCMGGSVGIDIERVRTDFPGEDIARRFFCDAEIDWLHGLSEEERAEGFFRLWTRKEAFLKARGEGIWHDLSRFDVSLSPPAPVRENSQSSEWFLHDLDPAPGYRAALAVQGNVTSVCCYSFAG